MLSFATNETKTTDAIRTEALGPIHGTMVSVATLARVWARAASVVEGAATKSEGWLADRELDCSIASVRVHSSSITISST